MANIKIDKLCKGLFLLAARITSRRKITHYTVKKTCSKIKKISQNFASINNADCNDQRTRSSFFSSVAILQCFSIYISPIPIKFNLVSINFSRVPTKNSCVDQLYKKKQDRVRILQKILTLNLF